MWSPASKTDETPGDSVPQPEADGDVSGYAYAKVLIERRKALEAGERTDAPWGKQITNATVIGDARFTDRFVIRSLMTTLPFVLSDIAALTLSGLIAVALIRLFGHSAAGWTMPLFLAPLVLIYIPWGLYPSFGMHPVIELRELTKLNTIAFVATMVGVISANAPLEWRAFFVLSWLAVLGLAPILRSRVRPKCGSHWSWGHPVLVVGSMINAQRIVRMMLKSAFPGLRPCGVFDPSGGARGNVEGIPIIHRASAAEAMIRTHGIRHGIVALPDMSPAQAMEVIDGYREIIPFLLVLSSSPDMPMLWGSSFDGGGTRGGGLSGIEVRNGLMLAAPRAVKRFMDVSLGGFVLLAALPLCVVVGIIVKLTSRGPMFFGHMRLGLGGQQFKAWKFRTMRVDGDAVLKAYLESHPEAREEWERDKKLKRDPRLTPLGGLFRKLSLDEFPQLWNVIRGEMSLVGPRPIVDGEIVKYGKVFRLYKDVKPGITGLWQVSGRSDTTYEERVQLDNYYVRNWSPWLDIHILARTVTVLVKCKGAY